MNLDCPFELPNLERFSVNEGYYSTSIYHYLSTYFKNYSYNSYT